MFKLFFAFLFTLFLNFGCGTGNQHSHLDYATFTPGRQVLRGWSAYTTIEQRGCALPVQLYAFNGTQVPPEQSNFIRQSVELAVSAWTGALSRNPYWKCPQARAIWGEGGLGTIQFYLDPTISRAYTIVGQNQVYLPLATTLPSDPYAERIILHEMGHIFGLADTYLEPGYQQPIGQPSGIMNRLFDVPWLTLDDIAGANAVYDYMNGRREFCSNGYTVGGAYENVNRIAFCVPQ